MAPNSSSYRPSYSGSHALVIGINRYDHVGPLAFAVNDATKVAETLIKQFGFHSANVTLMRDAEAKREAIMRSYLSYAGDKVKPNDRVLVFFAGHGHTVSGRRETGFLVPVDGDLSDLSTLIRWDELTRDADLIPAKHILFLMDACYGGLAVTRKAPATGSERYVEDMLLRVTRQVITAGRADEPVSDGDGTRPSHSIFTSHLLDALDGGAYSTPGVITAMDVLSYVRLKVGMDSQSKQTPHFGIVDGDGDFIFRAPAITTSPFDALKAADPLLNAAKMKYEEFLETYKVLSIPDLKKIARDRKLATKQQLENAQASLHPGDPEGSKRKVYISLIWEGAQRNLPRDIANGSQ